MFVEQEADALVGAFVICAEHCVLLQLAAWAHPTPLKSLASQIPQFSWTEGFYLAFHDT